MPTKVFLVPFDTNNNNLKEKINFIHIKKTAGEIWPMLRFWLIFILFSVIFSFLSGSFLKMVETENFLLIHVIHIARQQKSFS